MILPCLFVCEKFPNLRFRKVGSVLAKVAGSQFITNCVVKLE